MKSFKSFTLVLVIYFSSGVLNNGNGAGEIFKLNFEFLALICYLRGFLRREVGRRVKFECRKRI